MKLNIETIGHINLFEKLTGARVKDSWTENEFLVFLVEEGNIGRALGKDNTNLRKAESVFKKRIRIIGFSDDACKFVSNLIYPNKADDIKEDGNNILIYAQDAKLKGRIFGRDRENLKKVSEIVKRYFSSVSEIKIV
jgi:transcription termination/antitermination protein NusA